MEKNNTILISESKSSDIKQHEDAVLKTAMQFFADELLPYLGIEGKVISFAPTELVHLELQKLFQDFNLVMDDGTWKHFEFQSTNEGIEGLKRFRTYEALTSYLHKVSVETYVLFSGNIKHPMTQFTEGYNTYKIKPIIMQQQNADKLLADLEQKQKNGEIITKKDLISLILSPLMSGNNSQKDRIYKAYHIIRNTTEIEKIEKSKIEAMLYAMADKFLDTVDLEKLKEDMIMTRLGQMIWEDGIAEGELRGIEKILTRQIKIKLEKGKTVEEIADDLEESTEKITELMNIL